MGGGSGSVRESAHKTTGRPGLHALAPADARRPPDFVSSGECQSVGGYSREMRILHRGPMRPLQVGLVLKCRNPSYDNTMTPIVPVPGIDIGPVARAAVPPDAAQGRCPIERRLNPLTLSGRPHPPRRTIIEPIDTMNQLVRMSQIGDAESLEEPSPELRVPFAQSGAFVCKYIIGEPNDRAICCGARVSDGKSWCAYHRRIVFEPTRPGRIR
jgi:hypothetical protein